MNNETGFACCNLLSCQYSSLTEPYKSGTCLSGGSQNIRGFNQCEQTRLQYVKPLSEFRWASERCFKTDMEKL